MKWWICIIQDVAQEGRKPLAMFASEKAALDWVAESDRKYIIITREFDIALS